MNTDCNADKAWHIGRVRIPNPLVMAPMAGVTDAVFRRMVAGYGAGLTVSEMVSAKSIVMGSKNTAKLLTNFGAHPWCVQFFASDAQVLSEAIKRLEHLDFDIVNINMGCPMPKIVNNGEGAALMKNPRLVAALVAAATKASARPVSVKIRKGWSADQVNCVEIAQIAQQSGAAAVAVHGRTRDQFYCGQADWDAIAAVKDALDVPIIGNGDIFEPADALRGLGICDAVMIARGAMGNPWIFSRALDLMRTGSEPPPPDRNTVIRQAKAHLQESIAAGCPLFAMRKHLAWYTKGMPASSHMRRMINQAETAEEMERILDGGCRLVGGLLCGLPANRDGRMMQSAIHKI